MKDQETINILKGIILDGVDKAQSGHPGGALSSIDFAYILFTEYLRFDPDNVKWLGRDRFILSAGHESMLQYALLHAMGHLRMEELKRFRQLHSQTPGHPENVLTPGVECTTGPLGQGCAMSVGFALAGTHLRAVLGKEFFSHKTWVIMGDGCMQEGPTLASASLAGHLRLSHLVWYYDRNAQQISGSISRTTSDKEEKVFEGFGWNVLSIDGHDHAAIRKAIEAARSEQERPTIIIGRTTMAHGVATMEGQHETHGAPLPKDELKKTKEKLGLPADQVFYWPEEAKRHFQRNFTTRRSEVKKWTSHLAQKRSDRSFAESWDRYFGEEDIAKLPPVAWDMAKPMATRNAFGKLLESWCGVLPKLIGGSADLEPSNMTEWFKEKVGDFSAQNRMGRNLVFGVREFPMAAISNGIALHDGLIPFAATFLVFSDYARPAIRLGAIQKVRVIHEFTHDSFYLGEDGPTHQPIEHLMSLRAIPDLYVMRPADPFETEILFRHALSLQAPSCICLTRQKVPYLPLERRNIEEATKGAYIVKGEDDHCDLILFATGSEVDLALRVAEQVSSEFKVRVVSVPCWELFFEQSAEYQRKVLHFESWKRVSLEAGATLGWERFVGKEGLMVGIDHFGASAPAGDLEREFGFTVESVVKKIKEYFLV
ncbi:MAG: transketolase [Deltaproteobacteria bacterium]|nr:transketolase [Deltaproteobacteria bacterium]